MFTPPDLAQERSYSYINYDKRKKNIQSYNRTEKDSIQLQIK